MRIFRGKNQRKVQMRNFWTYHDRRKNPQPNGGYADTCGCGKAVDYCPECNKEQNTDADSQEQYDFPE